MSLILVCREIEASNMLARLTGNDFNTEVSENF